MKIRLVKWLIRFWIWLMRFSAWCDKHHVKEFITPILEEINKKLQDKYDV